MSPGGRLAFTTGTALATLTLAASVAAPEGMEWRAPTLAVVVPALYLLINRALLKRPRRPALVRADAPITAILASLLPLIILICAVAAMIWPGRDYGLAVIVGGIWFGLTLDPVLWPAKEDS